MQSRGFRRASGRGLTQQLSASGERRTCNPRRVEVQHQLVAGSNTVPLNCAAALEGPAAKAQLRVGAADTTRARLTTDARGTRARDCSVEDLAHIVRRSNLGTKECSTGRSDDVDEETDRVGAKRLIRSFDAGDFLASTHVDHERVAINEAER